MFIKHIYVGCCTKSVQICTLKSTVESPSNGLKIFPSYLAKVDFDIKMCQFTIQIIKNISKIIIFFQIYKLIELWMSFIIQLNQIPEFYPGQSKQARFMFEPIFTIKLLSIYNSSNHAQSKLMDTTFLWPSCSYQRTTSTFLGDPPQF